MLNPGASEELVHYKWGYLNGRLGHWTVADLDAVLLELFPAKVIVEDDEFDEVLDETRAFIEFLSDAGHLEPSSDDPAVLCRHLDRLGARFRRRMADRSRYSWGKRMWLAMAAEGIGPDGGRAVKVWVEQFNNLPDTQRTAILGAPAVPRSSADNRRPSRHSPATSRGHRQSPPQRRR